MVSRGWVRLFFGRWHHGGRDACGDGDAWRTRMHPRASRYHQLARLTKVRGAKRGANGGRRGATLAARDRMAVRRAEAHWGELNLLADTVLSLLRVATAAV
jgi:hypothetical protein